MMNATYLPPVEVAKRIRTALKKAFPAVRFSVRTSQYAGGSSISVRYNSSIFSRIDVEEVTNNYAGSQFDGMTDSSALVSGSTEQDGAFQSGADFVFVTNEARY